MKEETPSATARLVALGTILLGEDRRLGHLVPAGAVDYSRAFLAAAPGPVNAARFTNRGWFRTLMKWMERPVIPGLRLHFALRKRFIEETARRLIDEGTSQVVNLGAGFDTLAVRLHLEYPGVRFIETDHPATQRTKVKALEGRGLPKSNLRYVPADFTRETLEDLNLDLQAPTLFIIEGVFMYLSQKDVDAVFSFIRSRAAAESRVAFTFMEPRENRRVRFKRSGPLVDPWLKLMSEPFRWGIRRDELPGFLKSRGFDLEEVVGAPELRSRYLDGLGKPAQAEGECVAVTSSGGRERTSRSGP